MFFSFCCSVTKWCLTLWDPMDCSTPGCTQGTVTHHLMSRVSDAIQPAHPLPSDSLPALNLSQQWSLFQWVALHIMWPKYWSFSISPSNKYSGLISFRIDWLDLLAVEGTLNSLLQHHNLKVSMLWCLVFMVQLSHLYMTTEKPHFD